MSALRMKSGIVATLVASSVAMVLSVLSGTVLAADWHTVMSGKTETIEIDKSRIARGYGGTTGWSRVVLDRDVNDPGGAYNAIHAQNLYDCDKRRFTTLRRAYFKGDTLIREESVSRQRANNAQIGSIDERLLIEACRARSISEVAAVAEAARADANAEDDERPSAMHADMRTLAENARVRIVPVSDATPKPVTPAAAAAAAPTPSGEKPRHIALPAIDKAAATAASQAAMGATPNATSGASKPGVAAAPAAGHSVAPAPPPQRPVAKVTAPATSHKTATTQAGVTDDAAPTEKRVRELQYATSGPRRTAKKKPVEEAANPAHQLHVHWAYEGEGAPANWSKLRPDYASCATGRRQSPIDIREGIKVDLEAIKFDYKLTQFRAIDNGHTLQISVGEGLAMTIMGKRYELVQFHFHRPSEERVNGRLFDMVVHMVHKNDEGQLAVIAILLEKGGEHPVIQTLWNNMPLERDMEVSPADAIDLMKLLPDNRAYWTYMGSLTTPPCTENVLWMVMKQPVQVSPEQVSIFSRLYRNNARPIQPSNGRLIKESR